MESDSRTPVQLRAQLAEAQARLITLELERDRALADLALRERAINATTTGITIIDVLQLNSPIVYVNQAVAKRSGYEPPELIGRNGAFLFEGVEDTGQVKEIRNAIIEGREIRTEVKKYRKDGSFYWSGIFAGPVRDPGGIVTHFIILSADITARIEAEHKRAELQTQLDHEREERERMEIELKLSQKLESVGRLAAGIAHEINTPIQYVSDSAHFLRAAVGDLEQLLGVYFEHFNALKQQGLAEAMAQKIKDAESAADLEFLRDEIPRAFDRLLDGTERVTRIVRAMKEFAHPDTEEQSPSDLNHAIETTLMVAHNEYKYVASVDKQFGELPPVKCNVSELNQVFLNLIVNAAHAIESGGKAPDGQITITTRADGTYAEILIEDDGCGIPSEHIDKIYDPFFTTKEVGKGTGQGLAIARSIVVDHHAGTLDVESTVGIGTRFKIRLPIAGRSVSEGSSSMVSSPATAWEGWEGGKDS